MRITGTTKLYFTIGHPVAQARAPEVFNRVFETGGIDAVVVPALVAPQHLEAFVRATLASPTVQGFFVAIPHKAPMLDLAQRRSPAAQLAGATNAVRRGADGAVEADLLDGEGFVRALGHFGVTKFRKSLIVGAGGAACAIGAALAGAGAVSLDLYDIVPQKAARAAALLAGNFNVQARPAQSAEPAGYDLVVNASPAGLKPDDALPLDVDALDRTAVLVDIIMTPEPTPLVRRARQRGLKAFPGYEMLVQQVPLYLRFFGHAALAAQMEANLEDVRRHLIR